MDPTLQSAVLVVVDKFNPEIETEKQDYLLPEDQVKVETEKRTGTSEIQHFEFRAGPSYLSSCYDEFSRRFISVSVAKSASPTVPLVKTESENDDLSVDLHVSGILQQYHPGYSEWTSTFRKVPQDTRHLLSGKVMSDTNLVIKLKKCQLGPKSFEPIFGSICLYSAIGEDLHRVSETFYFDATPLEVRKHYSFVYVSEAQESTTDFSGSSVNVGDGSGLGAHMDMFCTTIPEELRGKDMFVVLQLSKILSTDADKAVAPYYPRASAPDADKNREFCKRLARFRQPVALGFVRINECLKGGKTEVKFPLYAQKLCVSEGFIAQSIREIYPTDGTAPYCRMDLLDGEMLLILHDLGRLDRLNAALREQGMAVQVKTGFDTGGVNGLGASSKKPLSPSGKASTATMLPRIYPSQVQSEASPLRYSRNMADLSAVTKYRSKLVMRQVMPLLPANVGMEVTRQFKTAVDNSLFVHPIQMERFQNRNLCLKMELVELTATTTLTSKTILTAPYVVLPNIYNHWSIVGPLFVSEALSRVNYHVKNPVLTDEFKVRLPDVLTGRHWLRFTALHIHVKPTVGRQSLLSSLIRSSVDKAEVESIELGVGMLPLMLNGGECLQQDQEHTIFMAVPGADTPVSANEQPFIRFRTRAVTSLVSSDAKVQAALRHHPCPLGYFPSSIISSEAAAEILANHKPGSASADRLVTATHDLAKASAVELSRHFLVIMRQLLRTLIAGHGVFDETYSHPYKHTKARSQAFLTILQVVGKIAGSDAGGMSSSFAGGASGGADGALSPEKEFLNAYVDFLFDEEVPVARHPAKKRQQRQEQIQSAKQVTEAISPSIKSGGWKASARPSLNLSLNLADAQPNGAVEDVLVSARSQNTDSTYATCCAGEITTTTSVNDINLIMEGTARPVFKSTASRSNYELISPKSKHTLPELPPSIEELENNNSSHEIARHGSARSLASDASFVDAISGPSGPKKYLSRTEGSQQHLRPVVGFRPGGAEEGDFTQRDRAGSRTSNVSIASICVEESPTGAATPPKAACSEVDSPHPARSLAADSLDAPQASESPENLVDSADSDSDSGCDESDEEDVEEADVAEEDNDDVSSAGEENLGRRSWGKFITDAVWSSGKLKSLGEILGGDRGGSGGDEAGMNELGEVYLEDIAAHVVLQAERIVLERMIAVAALAMASQVRFNSEREAVGQEGLHDVDEGLVLAGKRFHMPRGAAFEDVSAGVTPFDEERFWFAALDAGLPVDENELLVASSPQKKSTTVGFVDNVVAMETCAAGSLQSKIAIQPILPRYDTIEGYRERTASIAYTQYQSLAGISESSAHQWWPWLYEVVVFQWGAVLAIILREDNLIASKNIEAMVGSYPFELDAFQRMGGGLRDTRSLLMEHGPVLLKLVFKSLAMRVTREQKRPPVVLDDQFLNALENLVMLLAVEAVSFRTGLWRSRKLVRSLAGFLRSLFALVVPNQVIRLVHTYFSTVCKGRTDVEAAELRLQMIEEASHFDHIVAVNFPYALDAPQALFSFSALALTAPVDHQAVVAFTSAGFRSTHYSPPYALAHMLLSEVMSLYRLAEHKTKSAALEILRDLLVRHSYDARYRSTEAQQRVACMYLPLLKELVEDATLFSSLRHDAVDRREILAMALYVLQNIPRELLRHRIRQMCVLRSEVCGGGGVENKAGSSFETQVDGSISPRIISLRQRPSSLTCSFSTNFVQRSVFHDTAAYNLLLVLHLVLDTFEMPRVAENGSGTGTMSSLLQVLSPSVTVLASTEDNATDPAIKPSSQSAGANARRSTAELSVAGSSRVAMASSLLNSLDQRMQRKTNVSTAANRLSLNSSTASALSNAKSGDERKWRGHVRKMNENSDVPKDRTRALSSQATASASRNMCCSATTTVIDVLRLLFEEVPSCLLAVGTRSVPFVFRDCNLEESVLVGIRDLRIVEFMKVALAVVLHALYCHQDDASLQELFATSMQVLRQFGAKVVLVAVEDSLQDWMRVSLFHCASSSGAVRDAACNFLLCLMRSCHHFTGSFTLVSNTILAVLSDVLAEVLDNNRLGIVSHSDEDGALLGLHESIASMLVTAQSRYSAACWNLSNGPSSSTHTPPAPVSFYLSVARLMEDLTVLLQANADLRRFVSHPVVYDFFGANMLDGPMDERAFALSQLKRQQRKAIKTDTVGGGTSSSSTSTGFQIEEVMMRFVRAAEVYDPIKLPRFRIQWLENLARLHELRSNRAEGAEIRWRIFQLCQSVEDTWQQQWVPRPPLEWTRRGVAPAAEVNVYGHTESSAAPAPLGPAPDRSFYTVFLTAMNGRQFRAWSSYQQYTMHMVTTLDVATERFCLANLIHLAERTSSHLIQLYRMSKQVELIGPQYQRVFQAFRTLSEKGITSAMAVGTFYRVFYDGKGAPQHLRGKEFVFRNANHLHVSEFQALVVSHLKSVVAEGVEVRCVQDLGQAAAGGKNLEDPSIVYMVMNSVKLVTTKNPNRSSLRSHVGAKRPVSLSKLGNNARNTEALNQASVFQYSVPFTLDPLKAHAKHIDEQWLRTTVLTVLEPFPYILTRQLVYKRETRDFSPIEVAVNDIEERIEAMEAELERPEPTARNAAAGTLPATSSPSDNNNLMRIVQGTVMPQVNGGAAEVAKVFLSPQKLLSDAVQLQIQIEAAKSATDVVSGDQAATSGSSPPVVTQPRKTVQELMLEEQRMQANITKLKITLSDFLACSKLLLAKTRRVLLSEASSASLDVTQSAPENGIGPSNGPAANSVKGSTASTGNSGQKKTVDGSVNQSGTGSQPGPGISTQDQNYIIWQMEMERGFGLLVQSILPYIKDVVGDSYRLSAK